MPDNSLTHIYMVRDRSGSMNSSKAATDEGFDGFIAEQAKVDGKCLVTLADFDDNYEVVFAHRDVHEVPKADLKPRGGTALLDAIGKTVKDAEASIGKTPKDERPAAVIFVILTDGGENSSKQYTLPQIHEMITHQREHHDWQFVFIGANQDAIQAGTAMGFTRGMSVTYDAHSHAGTSNAFATTSSNIAATRSAVFAGSTIASAAASMNYSDAQRAETIEADDADETSSGS